MKTKEQEELEVKFFEAARYGCVSEMRECIVKEVNVDALNEDGFTAFEILKDKKDDIDECFYVIIQDHRGGKESKARSVATLPEKENRNDK